MAIPESIKKKANQVRNEVYGKDVREALASGIEEAGDIADQANTKSEYASDKVDNIQSQVDQLVVEGDSSVEAAQARVDADGYAYTTLKERLDTEYTEVTAQLAETKIDVFSRGMYVKSLGAIGDGIEDDTGILKQAFQQYDVVYLGKKGDVYRVTESLVIPSGKVVITNGAKIYRDNIVHVSEDYRSSCVRLENDIKIIGHLLVEAPTNQPTAGMVYMGVYQTGEGSKNITIDQLTLIGGGDNSNGVAILGASENIEIGSIHCPDNPKIGRVVMGHWGNSSDHGIVDGKYIHVNGYLPTTHPNNITIGSIKAGSLGWNDPSAQSGVAIFSASYNITINEIIAKEADRGFIAFAGDIGYGYADENTIKKIQENGSPIKIGKILGQFRKAALRVQGYAAYPEQGLDTGDGTFFDANFDVHVSQISATSTLSTHDGIEIYKNSADNVGGVIVESATLRNFLRAGQLTQSKNIVLRAIKGFDQKMQFLWIDKCDNVTIGDPYIEGTGVSGSNGFQRSGIVLDNSSNVFVFGGITRRLIDDFANPVYIRGTNTKNITIDGHKAYDGGTEKVVVKLETDLSGISYDAEIAILNLSHPVTLTSVSGAVVRRQVGRIRVGEDFNIPTHGTWGKGDIVYNLNPTAGGYVGWICTAAGSPGTWKGFGAIQA